MKKRIKHLYMVKTFIQTLLHSTHLNKNNKISYINFFFSRKISPTKNIKTHIKRIAYKNKKTNNMMKWKKKN